jgi:prepilin-type N-terminal cleavage/methylation domain-containing protein
MSIINTYMRNYFKLFKRNSGFTLIELLVVIGILGVLAAALIATIDPFEQIKKAQDSNTKNAAVEFNDSLLRYYATHNAFPWAATPANGGNGAGCNGAAAPDGSKSLTDVTMGTCVTALTAENELKSAFAQDKADLQDIYVTYDSTANDTIACFQPQSKSQQQVALMNADGSAGPGLATHTCAFNNGVPADPKGGCFWCTQAHSVGP